MSSLIVEVCKISDVLPHPNADRMQIALIKGWRCCIGKGSFQKDDLCVYLPPDAILPIPLATSLNVVKYCSEVKNEKSEVIGVRVKVARLRGEPSYGFPIAVENSDWPEGKDVAEFYGITKYEPPLVATDGDAEKEHPAFHKYFTLENINNFPDVIEDGEEVVFTEKIHGKNCRLGLIRDSKEDGTPIWRFMAGSHDVRRKEMQTQVKRRQVLNPDGSVTKTIRNDYLTNEPKEVDEEWSFEVTKKSQFFEALDKPGVRNLLMSLCNGKHNVVIFGEIYGSSVQDMAYGFQNGHWDLRVFDITIDGKYIDVDDKISSCNRHLVQMVPILYRGPYSRAKVDEYVTGPTTLCNSDEAGSFKGREGIVITTVKERTVNHPAKFFDRAALKAISFDYLERKDGTEYH